MLLGSPSNEAIPMYDEFASKSKYTTPPQREKIAGNIKMIEVNDKEDWGIEKKKKKF